MFRYALMCSLILMNSGCFHERGSQKHMDSTDKMMLEKYKATLAAKRTMGGTGSQERFYTTPTEQGYLKINTHFDGSIEDGPFRIPELPEGGGFDVQ